MANIFIKKWLKPHIVRCPLGTQTCWSIFLTNIWDFERTIRMFSFTFWHPISKDRQTANEWICRNVNRLLFEKNGKASRTNMLARFIGRNVGQHVARFASALRHCEKNWRTLCVFNVLTCCLVEKTVKQKKELKKKKEQARYSSLKLIAKKEKRRILLLLFFFYFLENWRNNVDVNKKKT